jgi:hypothetical protein
VSIENNDLYQTAITQLQVHFCEIEKKKKKLSSAIDELSTIAALKPLVIKYKEFQAIDISIYDTWVLNKLKNRTRVEWTQAEIDEKEKFSQTHQRISEFAKICKHLVSPESKTDLLKDTEAILDYTWLFA